MSTQENNPEITQEMMLSLSEKYNLWNYGENVVKRSLNDMQDIHYNRMHMITGLTSELTDEYITALIKNDLTNICEELGDAVWFCTGLLIVNGYFTEKYKEAFINSDALLYNLNIDWNNPDALTQEQRNGLLQTVINMVFKKVGAINTIFKNILIKDTPKYDGKVLTEEEIVNEILSLIIGINNLSLFTGKNIFQIREMNDKKLFLRHNGTTLTAESSLNRDTDAERKILEDNI